MQLYTISLLSEEAGSELGKRHGPGRSLQHSLTTIYLYLSGHRLDWLKSAHFEGLDTGGKTLTRVLNKKALFYKACTTSSSFWWVPILYLAACNDVSFESLASLASKFPYSAI